MEKISELKEHDKIVSHFQNVTYESLDDIYCSKSSTVKFISETVISLKDFKPLLASVQSEDQSLKWTCFTSKTGLVIL
jgi:hypothetical protein